ncbi:MAG: hypothetical protein IJ313_04525 [Clostridia bacterium]|nr:hypothetical protein [Clostridia bacterium]
MIERYELNRSILPTIPVPHDCIITDITENDEYLVFTFEEDISYHDSIKAIHPSAKGLIIRFHVLFDDVIEGAQLYQYKASKHGTGYMRKKIRKLFKTVNQKNKRLEYLNHYLSYNSIAIELFSKSSIILLLYADYVEFEWIERHEASDAE